MANPRRSVDVRFRTTIEQGGKTGYILGADCSLSGELDEERIRWVVEAARKI